jgi:ADP-ribosylglycohydrolase
MSKKKRVPIDELLEYWTDISKRPSLTLDDYRLFFERVTASMEHFEDFYGGRSPPDKFLDRMNYMWFYRDKLLKRETQRAAGGKLSNNAYAHMKDVGKNFIRRIKKCFGQDIVAAIDKRTPLQDAEALLAHSSKLTHRWAAGIVASNYIATILIKLSKFRAGEKYRDDIITLKDNLRNRTTNQRLKTFVVRSHRRFEDADKLRNRCAHVTEGDPTKQEIEQSIALARLLQKYR